MILRRTLTRSMLPLTLGGILISRMALGAEVPYLSAPASEDKLTGLPAIEVDDIRKEADALQRKATLLKEAADKKYAEATRLRQQAGTYRSQASAQAQALQARAASTQGTSELLGSLFGMIGGMSPTPSPTLGLTSQLMNANQAMDARTAAEQQTQAGQVEMAAEKNAGPLEMRAQTYEEEGNRLLAAYNRLQSLTNAKLLLLASEELRQTILQDREYLAAAKKRL